MLDTMGARLRVPIVLATPLANLTAREGALESLDAEAVAPLFMLAIGLALRGPG
jgi:Tfp pilus assembly PilM family ATPase